MKNKKCSKELNDNIIFRLEFNWDNDNNVSVRFII